jgi:hypothetical protein
MFCARATLTAGPRHKRYKAGTAVRALIFSTTAQHPDDLDGEAFKPLAARGWKRITIDGHSMLSDEHQFNSSESGEAAAFRAALEKGIGVAVLGLVQ